jgi:hypothetical protein
MVQQSQEFKDAVIASRQLKAKPTDDELLQVRLVLHYVFSPLSPILVVVTSARVSKLPPTSKPSQFSLPNANAIDSTALCPLQADPPRPSHRVS